MEIPMLDESEYTIVRTLYADAMGNHKARRRKEAESPKPQSIEEKFQPVCDAYEQITGYRETNANAVMHHRLAQYGPPCGECGKPLRTPRARFCAACGWKPADPAES
jgi:hypothetical protein